MKLTRGMFGEGSKNKCTEFGIWWGQMIGEPGKITHNAGWYNKAGEKLGWGDLSTENFKRISKELDEGELFVTLPESASFWKFVEKFGATGSLCQVNNTEYAPGKEYIAENANFLIGKDILYFVDCYERGLTITKMYGLTFQVVKPEDVIKLL